MSDQLRFSGALTRRPGMMVPPDWHVALSVGEQTYVAISSRRWLACLKLGRLLHEMIRDLERKPPLPGERD